MIIAVDTGGTKTLIEAFNTEGTKTHIVKFPTPRDPREYLAQLTEHIKSYAGERPIDAITVALPGIIRGHELEWAPNIGWRDLDIIAALQPSFPGVLLSTGNDADIAGLAEMRSFDSAPGTGLYVTLSTGVGTGICFDGQLDPLTSVFEGGHMMLQFEGKPQRWEDFASGKNFYERYGKLGADIDDPEVWRDYANRVTAGLQVLLPVYRPERVVIGGSMGTHFAKYRDFLTEQLSQTVPDFVPRIPITQAKHPEEAVIYGCYYYAVDQLALAEAV